MSQLEAWTVTGLGMLVVFIGLVLCIAFIQLFNRIARRITWGGEGHGAHGSPAQAPEPAAEPSPDLPPSEPVPADVLAVIAAVLEVESKLYLSKPGSRLTIRRPAPQY
jgi:Na+-transporting methylmalonyl-CoA/oxaloacetate decarboxylase gamma subunit